MLEVWKPVYGWEDLYEISNKGNLKSCKNDLIRKAQKSTTGYYYFLLHAKGINKHKDVHLLMAEAFIGRQIGKCVNHINGIKTDNRLENLEYISNRENINHAKKLTKHLKGVVKNSFGKYKGVIKINGKQVHLGTFNTEIEAHTAYVAKCKELNQDRYVGEKS